jgi:UDP-2-acetamido-2-deoxy-ribo-hexuluronate aminotransferase
MTVPFFNYATSFKRQWPELQVRLDKIIAGQSLCNGPMCRELEAAIARYAGARHAVSVGNATDGLFFLLLALGIGAGDEVIVPCFTFFASASAVARTGARPIFVDIEPSTYAMDPDAVIAAIGPRTKAIMPVHLFNQMADMDALCSIAKANGIDIIEDSAEAIGMWWGKAHAGLLGRGGVISFFPTKTLGAFGDAGMVITNEDAIADKIRALRDNGRAPDTGVMNAVGVNSKMDEIQAAILLSKLPYLDAEIAKRQNIVDLYSKQLGTLGQWVQLPVVVPRSVETNAVHYVYLIEVDQRDALVRYLSDAGIATEQYYPIPLHLQPCFDNLGYRSGAFPSAERACRRTVALPLYPDLSSQAVIDVCIVLNNFFHGNAK